MKLPVDADQPGQSSNKKLQFNNELLLADASDRLLRLCGWKLLAQHFSCVIGRKCVYARRHWIITSVAILFPLVGYFIAAIEDYQSSIVESCLCSTNSID